MSQLSAVTSPDISTAVSSLLSTNTEAIIAAAAAGEAAGQAGLTTMPASDLSEVVEGGSHPTDSELAEREEDEADGDGM